MWPKAIFAQISKFHFLKFWQTKCIHPSLPVVKHVSINWFPLLLVPFAELVRMKTNPLMLVESMVPLRSTKWLAISTSLRESKNSQDNYVINYTFIVGSKVKAKKFPIILLCTCRIPKRVTKKLLKITTVTSRLADTPLWRTPR